MLYYFEIKLFCVLLQCISKDTHDIFAHLSLNEPPHFSQGDLSSISISKRVCAIVTLKLFVLVLLNKDIFYINL